MFVRVELGWLAIVCVLWCCEIDRVCVCVSRAVVLHVPPALFDDQPANVSREEDDNANANQVIFVGARLCVCMCVYVCVCS